MVENKKNIPAKTSRTRRAKTVKIAPEPPLTPEELEYFKEKLLVLRREILGDMGAMTGSALDHSGKSDNGELSNMPVHMADIGTDNYEQEFTLGLIESERKVLREIDAALGRIQDGSYGLCEATDVVINRARLEAHPYARYCIEHARQLEQGLAKAKRGLDRSSSIIGQMLNNDDIDDDND